MINLLIVFILLVNGVFSRVVQIDGPSVTFYRGNRDTFQKPAEDDQKRESDVIEVQKSLQSEIIPRFKKHIDSIMKKSPNRKTHLTVKISKTQKSLNNLRKKVEEAKVRLQRTLNKIARSEEKKKKLSQELTNAQKAKNEAMIRKLKRQLRLVTLKHKRTKKHFEKLQQIQQRTVKNEARVTTKLRSEKNKLRKYDELTKIRVDRNNNKIKEIENLLHMKEQSQLEKENIVKKYNERKGKIGNAEDNELQTLEINMKRVMRKDKNLNRQLELILDTLNERQQAKNAFKKAKHLIKKKIIGLKILIKRDRAVLRRETIKRNILRKKLKNVLNKRGTRLRASVALNKSQSENYQNYMQAKKAVISLTKKMRDEKIGIMDLRRKLRRATKIYIKKKMSLEGKVAREHMMDMKLERRKLRFEIKRLNKKMNEYEKELVSEENTTERERLNNEMKIISKEIEILEVKTKELSKEISTYFDKKEEKANQRIESLKHRRTVLERRIVVMKRLRRLNEKNMETEKIKMKRRTLLKKERILTKKIKKFNVRSRRLLRLIRNLVIRKYNRVQKKNKTLDVKLRKIRHKIARHAYRIKHYQNSQFNELKSLIPSLQRRLSEEKQEFFAIRSKHDKYQDLEQELYAEVKEIRKQREEESRLRRQRMLNERRRIMLKLKSLEGKEDDDRVDDLRRMLIMKQQRIERKLNHGKLMQGKKRAKLGIKLMKKVLNSGFRRIKRIVFVANSIYKLRRVNEQASMILQQIDTVKQNQLNETQHEKLEKRKQKLLTTISMNNISIQKKVDQLKQTVKSLLRATAVVNGINSATLFEQKILQARLIVKKDKLEREVLRINQTQGITRGVINRINEIEDIDKRMKENLNDLRSLAGDLEKYITMVTKLTRNVHDAPHLGNKCSMCKKLAQEAFSVQQKRGFGRIIIVRKMDNYCKKSKYPISCYRVVLGLQSELELKNHGHTPEQVCRNIEKC